MQALETGEPLAAREMDLISLQKEYVTPIMMSLRKILKAKMRNIPRDYRDTVEELLDDEIKNLGVGMAR